MRIKLSQGVPVPRKPELLCYLTACFILALLPLTLSAAEVQSNSKPANCLLRCSVNTEGYSIDITCESGDTKTEREDEGTSYEYDAFGQVAGLKTELNQKRTYLNNNHTYTIKGHITVNKQKKTTSYNITVKGPGFGDTPQTCKG